MTALFWVGIVWLVYVYFGYPVLLGVLGFLRRVSPRVRDDILPTVSVLIAARNEEKDIGWKIRQTLQWDYPADRLEVLVASDASTDRTDEIVREINDPRLVFLRLKERGGKNVALNRLADQARGELLFFTDANSDIGPSSLRCAVRHFADPRVGCVTGEMQYVGNNKDSVVGAGDRLYWRYESLIKWLESRIGSTLVCVGSIFCIRRSLYTPLQPQLANDAELPLRIGHQGCWIRYEPGACSREKPTHSPWEEFARRRRTCAQGMLAMWTLRETLHGLRGWQFFSRKFLRWLTLVPLLLVLFSTIGLASSPLFAALLGLQGVFYGLAATGLVLALFGRRGGRLVSVPFHLMIVNVAGLVGVVDTCTGRRFQVWDIATLSRGRDKGSDELPVATREDHPDLSQRRESRHGVL